MLKDKIVFFVFLGLLLALPLQMQAAGLYQGTAPANSQSDDDRANALRTALGQVLTRLSGDPNVTSRPEVQKALGRADRYMQLYSYQPNKTAPSDPAQPPARFILVAQFDGDRVDALMRELNLTGTAPAGADGTPAPVAVPGSYRLWISGLRSAEDYARLIGGLSSNDQVRGVRVEQTHGNGVQVKVDTRGALQTLLDSLGASRLAHATNTHPPVDGVDALLDFEP